MKFEDALAAMRAGKKVRRASWHPITSWTFENVSQYLHETVATDWEILPDPEPEPQWLLLEPGMTIREGDETPVNGRWESTCSAGAKVCTERDVYRRRITP